MGPAALQKTSGCVVTRDAPSTPLHVYDEPVRYLANSDCRTSFLDPVQYIPLVTMKITVVQAYRQARVSVRILSYLGSPFQHRQLWDLHPARTR